MTWSGPGIPVIGGQILSGAQAVVVTSPRYLVEHPVPGMEGGPVENLGRPQDRIEIHGIAYESGADQFLAALSGLANSFQTFSIPSFNSGFYFADPGTNIEVKKLRFLYEPGYGYPFYHYIVDAVVYKTFPPGLNINVNTVASPVFNNALGGVVLSAETEARIVYVQGMWWAFYVDSTTQHVVYKTSTDGVTWSAAANFDTNTSNLGETYVDMVTEWIDLAVSGSAFYYVNNYFCLTALTAATNGINDGTGNFYLPVSDTGLAGFFIGQTFELTDGGATGNSILLKVTGLSAGRLYYGTAPLAQSYANTSYVVGVGFFYGTGTLNANGTVTWTAGPSYLAKGTHGTLGGSSNVGSSVAITYDGTNIWVVNGEGNVANATSNRWIEVWKLSGGTWTSMLLQPDAGGGRLETSDGTNLIVVYNEFLHGYVEAINSTNGGTTWSANTIPTQTHGWPPTGSECQFGVGRNGNMVYVAWNPGNGYLVFFSYTIAGGWSAQKTLVNGTGGTLGMTALCTDGSNFISIWYDGANNNISEIHSKDGGTIWSSVATSTDSLTANTANDAGISCMKMLPFSSRTFAVYQTRFASPNNYALRFGQLAT